MHMNFYGTCIKVFWSTSDAAFYSLPWVWSFMYVIMLCICGRAHCCAIILMKDLISWGETESRYTPTKKSFRCRPSAWNSSQKSISHRGVFLANSMHPRSLVGRRFVWIRVVFALFQRIRPNLKCRCSYKVRTYTTCALSRV